MSQNAHVVVVDDEPDLREGVATFLRRQGFAVSEAESGEALRALMKERPVDLVLLDISMSGEDGLSIARYLRQQGRIGIVMLTAANDSFDRVIGLEVGADDYIGKPFELREVLARVRAVLRRLGETEAPATMGHEVRFGRCLLNLDTRKLFDLDGSEVAITAMEYDLLRTFAEHPNRVLSREQILDQAHNKSMEAFDRSVDLRVVRLRRKIEVDPSVPQVIKTVRGAGYIFSPGARGAAEPGDMQPRKQG